MHLFQKYAWLSMVFFTSFLSLSTAHIRLVCPRPVSPRSDIKNPTVSPIGKDKCLVNEGSDQDVLEVHPGLFTIRFEETKFMIGSPIRVLLFTSLSSGGPKDDEKRDLKSRERRDASNVTTDDNTHSFQNVLDIMNRTLNSMTTPDNSLSANSSLDQRISDHNNNESSSFSNNSTTDDESGAVDQTTKNDAGFETSTASKLHGQSTESLPEDVTMQDGGKDSDMGRAGGSSSSAEKESHSCLLLDHIPHNDQAIISSRCSKQGNSFPLGICEESTYYMTIRIPDVFCPDCFLVVQQVGAKPDHEVCDITSRNESECISYISCSRISIRPSTEGMDRNLSHCSNYLDNLPDDWAYRPQDIYKVLPHLNNISLSEMAGESAVLTMDLLHRDLHLEVMRGLVVGPTEKVEIRHNQDIIWTATKSESHMNADSLLLVWSQVPDKYLNILKQNKLVLNVIGSKKSQALDILFQSQIFGAGQMSLLHDMYSHHGWLIANRFLGPTAKDPMAALPVGPCVPPAKHFLVFFGAVEAGYHGLLGMTLLENRAYITAILHVELGTIQSIRFRGSDLVGAKDVVVKVPDSFSGVFQAALDFTQQMKYIDTIQFLKTVEVKTNRQDAVLVGTLEEGFYSVLRDQKGKVKGLGAFQPTQGYWMRAEIVLSNLADPRPKVKTAQLLGSHMQLMDLSKEIVNCTREFCSMETYVHELSSEFLLHLLTGQAIVEVNTQSDDLSGQIVGSTDCSRYGGMCLIEKGLSKNNALTKTYGGTVSAVVLLDRAEVLEISVQVNHPDWGWSNTNYTAVLTAPDGGRIKLPLHFMWITEELYAATERYPLAKNRKISKRLDYSNEEIHLHISNGVHTLLKDQVYGLRKKDCIQSKIHVVGKDKDFWSAISSPFEMMHGVVLDYVKFVYDNNTTSLYLMDSKESFSKCDFSKAKKITATSFMGGLAIYFYKLTSPGTFYFADKESCLYDTPAKLRVVVVKGKDSLVQDKSREDWCRTSFYSAWRENQLAKWEPPSVAGPVVLGLFLGLTTGIGFILWQGMKMKQMTSPGASASRNSLSHFVRF